MITQNISPSTNTSGAEMMRGGTKPVTVPGISWRWLGLENFPAEQEKLTRENLTTELNQAAIIVTLDAQSDPLQVLVNATKDGIAQPELSLKLPKQVAPAMRPAMWVSHLQQLQSTLQSAP
jgi:hypothetical protein